MVCRCERPKILYDLLQSFSKHGNWSKSGASGSYGGKFLSGTQTEDATLHKLHPMTIFCTKEGLTIHSQSSNKQSQASMELPASLFGYYRLTDSSGNDGHGDGHGDDHGDLSYDFTIHWQTFMQCLNLLMIGTGGDKTSGSNPAAGFFRNHSQNAAPAPNHSASALTLSYHTSTEVLRMEWEGGCQQGSVVATAAIPGLNPPPADEAAELSAAFGQSPIAARWLCPHAGHELAETRELDHLPGATTVRLRFLRASEGGGDGDGASGPRLRLSARGHSGRVSIEIPAPIEFLGGAEGDDRGADHEKLAYSYSLASWKRALQPLDMARETCLSVNTRGILAVQHQLFVDSSGASHRSRIRKRSMNEGNHPSQQHHHSPPTPPESAFCDFLLLPLEVDEDRDADSDEEDTGLRTAADDCSAENGYDDDDDDDDDRLLTPRKSSQSSLSHATGDKELEGDGSDDEDGVRAYTETRKQRRRRILSATQESENFGGVGDDDNDNEGTNAASGQPVGSESNDDRDGSGNEATAPRNLLFPTVVTGTGTDAGSGGVHHLNRRRDRERRKRQRRSGRLSNPTTSVPSGVNEDNDPGEELDDESQAPSVNLLEDDDDDDNDDRGDDARNGVDGDHNGYCSSPELVYGQQD